MTTDTTKIALRVLTAINKRERPKEDDLVALRAHAPDHGGLDPDELACVVIQQAMEQRRTARETRVNGQLKNSATHI
jgi:hypothetical protein